MDKTSDMRIMSKYGKIICYKYYEMVRLETRGDFLIFVDFIAMDF